MGDMIDLRKENEARARSEAVVGILLDWSDWQNGYRVKVGYSTKSAGFQSGGVVGDSSSSDAYASADNARFEIVDSCVDDLTPAQKAAIYHHYCHSVYRMRDFELEESLLAAHAVLDRVFRAKGILW